jgi:hypothetical protein
MAENATGADLDTDCAGFHRFEEEAASEIAPIGIIPPHG